MQVKTQSNSQSRVIDDAVRQKRVERIRRHYLREAQRIEAFNRKVTITDLIGFWASIVWLLFACYFANPSKGWIWDHPFVLAFALLIAVAGYRIGASMMTAFVALFVTAKGFQLLFDRHFTYGLLAVSLSLAVVWLVWFAADIANQGWMGGKHDAKYVPPDQDMLDRFAEIEARISAGEPFGIFLRSYYKETPLPSDSGPDYRPFDAIRNLIGSGDTYSIPHPNDPVHANPFPTAIADPANWMVELNRALAHASWIVLFYEYETLGLDEVVRLLEEKHAGKSVAVFGPEVSAADPIRGLLSSACMWSFQLQFEQAEVTDRSDSDALSLPMSIDAPPTFHDWLEARKSISGSRESKGYRSPTHRDSAHSHRP
jgi:hypothetical protein